VLGAGCSGNIAGGTDTTHAGPVDGGGGAGCANAGGSSNRGAAGGGAGTGGLVGSGGFVVGSGGAAVPQASTLDACPTSDARACGSALRVPQQHRARPETCPRERGSENPLNLASCADTSGIVCKSDADCTAGMNGRCFLNSDPCRTYCSYDECLADTDCPAGQPCMCRTSGTEKAPNSCVAGSSCATDADCGKCGFCSLSSQRTMLQCSLVNPCSGCDAGDTVKCTCLGVTSEAFACHTMNDECTNDSDCPAMGGYCAYADDKKHWACAMCLPHL
jgi:hypothetical protein